MSITATRLGKSAITLGWSGVTGFESDSQDSAKLKALHEELQQWVAQGKIGFWGPHMPTGLPLPLPKIPLHIRDCIWIGIGGSSLGPRALHRAMPTSQISMHFLEAPDSRQWQELKNRLNPKSTLVIAVSKSGMTFETIALFITAVDWLKQNLGPDFRKHVWSVTDPEQGDLWQYTRAENLELIAYPHDVGGRYSILSVVGELALAVLAGQENSEDIRNFHTGALHVKSYLETTPPEKNAVLKWALSFTKLARSHPNHFFLNYSQDLCLFGEWSAQLIAESLGKNGTGFTPVAHTAPQAQHGQLQLLIDGPKDKLVWVISVDARSGEKIPALRPDKGLAPSIFSALHGRSFEDLTKLEAQSTERALIQAKVPTVTISMDSTLPNALGAYSFFMCALTVSCGIALKVNPFDQPAVEGVKSFIKNGLTD